MMILMIMIQRGCHLENDDSGDEDHDSCDDNIDDYDDQDQDLDQDHVEIPSSLSP